MFSSGTHIFFQESWCEYGNTNLHNRTPNLITKSDKSKFPQIQAKFFSAQACILRMCVKGEKYISY